VAERRTSKRRFPGRQITGTARQLADLEAEVATFLRSTRTRLAIAHGNRAGTTRFARSMLPTSLCHSNGSEQVAGG